MDVFRQTDLISLIRAADSYSSQANPNAIANDQQSTLPPPSPPPAALGYVSPASLMWGWTDIQCGWMERPAVTTVYSVQYNVSIGLYSVSVVLNSEFIG